MSYSHDRDLSEKNRRMARLWVEIDATSKEDRASYREETEWWDSAQEQPFPR
jgi:hypothetical protein